MNDTSVFTKLQERVAERADDQRLRRSLNTIGEHEVLLSITEGGGCRLRFAPAGIECVETAADTAADAETGADATLAASGPAAAWESLLAGERTWIAATNAALGDIRTSGDPVSWAWLLPVMSQLFAKTPRSASVYSDLGSHADTAGITGRYATVDGVQAYYEATAGDDSDESAAILLLHTAGRDGRQWHGVMERLGSRHRLYAPDLPGHGKSWPQRPEPCLSDIEDIAQWLLSFMSEVGEERFIVAGTSVGGNLALLLPALSDRVSGSVAFQGSDLTPTISEAALSLMDHPRVALQFSAMDQALELIGEAAVPEAVEMIDWSIRTLSPPAQRGDLTAYSHTDTRDRMADIRCPIMLVHGDRDWLATRDMIDQAAARIVNAEHLEVLTMPGIGHYPHLESPEEAAELIETMAERVLRR